MTAGVTGGASVSTAIGTITAGGFIGRTSSDMMQAPSIGVGDCMCFSPPNVPFASVSLLPPSSMHRIRAKPGVLCTGLRLESSRMRSKSRVFQAPGALQAFVFFIWHTRNSFSSSGRVRGGEGQTRISPNTRLTFDILDRICTHEPRRRSRNELFRYSHPHVFKEISFFPAAARQQNQMYVPGIEPACFRLPTQCLQWHQ